MPTTAILRVLARAFLSGEQSYAAILERANRALGRRWRWLQPLTRRYLSFTDAKRPAFANESRPRARDVVRFLRRDDGLGTAAAKYASELHVADWLTEPMRMRPVGAAETWDIPPIESVGDLAKWLQLSIGELEWFANLADRNESPQLRHYHFRTLSKRPGSTRLIEAPKPRLKALQRRILAEILEAIPAHAAVHGFLKGHSIKTFVAPHVGRRVVLKMDLQDFFPRISGARIQALFRTMGYPEAVADLLAGLCVNAAPSDAWSSAAADLNRQELWDARKMYARRHLPQGAPTSPALANICAYRADCRLAGLAKSAGAEYTRYADDLAFSGGEEFERCVERFSLHAAAILLEEGFLVHHRKTRIMRASVRQHLAGLVANQRLNIRRDDFDRLKATLTNCVRLGPASQNRDGHADFRRHLLGRVGFVEMIHANRGRRVREILERIQWE